MTKRQRLFIDDYIKTLNASQSALNVGYKDGSVGRHILQKEHIKHEVSRRFEEQRKEYAMTKDDFIKRTLDLHKATSHPAVKARYWELLARVCSFVEPEVKQHVSIFNASHDLQGKLIQKRINNDVNATVSST